MISKKTFGLVLLTTISFSFIASLAFMTDVNFDNNSIIEVEQESELLSSIGTYPANNIFFNHSSDDTIVHTNLSYLYTHSDSSKTAFFQHSFNNTALYNITDNSFFSSDQFYYMMGLGRQIYDKVFIPGRIDSYKDSPFWDDINGGFYSQLYNNLTPVSSEKFVFDNLLAIMFLFNTLGGSQSYGVSSKISDLWTNVIIKLFWDPVHYGLNHSNLQNTTRYTSDNLLGAIVAFRIAREPQLDASLRTTALVHGNQIMSKYNYTSTLFDEIDAYAGFYNYADVENQKTGSSNKFLLTNALGISALLDWNMAGTFNQKSLKVNASIDMWKFMKSKFYNTTYRLYMTEISREGDTKFNPNMDLLFNAWMLRATLDLFKTTGNITYYNAALEHFNGIEQNLHDSEKKGYYGSTGLASNDLKRTDSFNMLLASLYDFYDIYNSTKLIPTINQTSYIFLQDTKFNVSISFNISMNFDYSTTVGSKWSINTPIQNAPIELTLRNAENNSIINEQFGSTDSKGKFVYLYTIPQNLPVEIYKISMMCNKTGYMLTYNNGFINYISGLSVEGYTQLGSKLYQGEICTLNVSIYSTRKTNITVSLQTDGDNFVLQSANNIHIKNNTRTYALVNISAEVNSPIGDQSFYLDLLNGTVLLNSGSQSITVESAVEIKFMQYNQYLIDLQDHKLSFVIVNHRSQTAETVNIKISGTYVVALSQNIGPIQPLEEIRTTIYLSVEENTPLGELSFHLNAFRNNNVFFNRTYSVKVVDEIEVISIQSSQNVYHGQSPYVSITLFNYNISEQTVIIRSNGITIKNEVISYGQQVINVPINNVLFSPYDVSEKNYIITILDSEQNIIGQTTVFITPTISISSAFYFYILPIIVAIAVIMIFKHKQLENDKRK